MMQLKGRRMNANELADAMEIRASIRRKATSRKSVTEGANDRLADQLDQAATMLRQQQAEIEALKAGKIRAYDNGVEDGRKPNTHPVKELTDRIAEQEKFIKAILKKGGCDGNICQKYNANPVKELTDEEILDTFDPHFDTDIEDKELIKFARAILRKA